MKYLSLQGLRYFWNKIQKALSGKVDKVQGKGLSTNDYTTVQKNKLGGIAEGANKYTHPSSHPISMISGLQTELNKKVETDTTYTAGTNVQISESNVISATDTKYTHPTSHPISMISGLQGALDSKLEEEDLTWEDISGKPTSFNPSTHTHSINEVTNLQNVLDDKLESVDLKWASISGKPSTFTPSTHTHTIANVTNLQSSLNSKVDMVTGKGLSTNDYTTAEKNKLSGIAAGANNYTHPATHPYSMITGAPTKLPADGGDSATVNGMTVLSNVPANAKFTDTVYTHPGSGTNPHSTTKADVGLSNVDNVKQATKSEFDSHTTSDRPHTYGNFAWEYNETNDSLDLVVYE